jgi:hypothetical protein
VICQCAFQHVKNDFAEVLCLPRGVAELHEVAFDLFHHGLRPGALAGPVCEHDRRFP